MSSTETSAAIVELMHQAYFGESGKRTAWHGPSVWQLLDGVNASDAANERVERETGISSHTRVLARG